MYAIYLSIWSPDDVQVVLQKGLVESAAGMMMKQTDLQEPQHGAQRGWQQELAELQMETIQNLLPNQPPDGGC